MAIVYGYYVFHLGLPGSSVLKKPPTSVGDAGSIPGSRRFPGEGNDNPLQYSWLGNPMEPGRLESMVSQRSWT